MGLPRIAVTLGDPRGIGPEITARAMEDAAVAGIAEFVLVGAETEQYGPPEICVGSWRAGDGPAAAGKLAGDAIEAAVAMAMRGDVRAIVTAPIEKSAFRAGGWSYPGHTEMLRDLTGSPAVGMLLSSEGAGPRHSLRVVLATTHLPLREVPSALSSSLLVEQCLLTSAALRDWWDLPRPRIALCAFNPHASDGGLFGDEEQRIYAPALRDLERLGLEVAGPIPADTVFMRALRGEFDAVVAPYHDVGMAAFKTAAFGSGVNVTLGLPFPRTSPDHGTAMDIAGRGVADPGSMIQAMRLAVRLAGRLYSGPARD